MRPYEDEPSPWSIQLLFACKRPRPYYPSKFIEHIYCHGPIFIIYGLGVAQKIYIYGLGNVTVVTNQFFFYPPTKTLSSNLYLNRLIFLKSHRYSVDYFRRIEKIYISRKSVRNSSEISDEYFFRQK